jgi:serine/threonine protein phosphatase PrpC
MLLDSYFAIGKTHKLCEDYVTLGYKPIPYIIVADGCSSSQNTDVGARILAWAMAKAITSLYNRVNVIPFDYDVLAHTAIAMARSQADALGLDTTATDTTIVVAFYHNEHIWVYMYGDGIIFLKRIDGTIDFFSVSYEFMENGEKRERPYYLSYLVNPYRKSVYMDAVIASNPEMTVKRIYNHLRQDNVSLRFDAKVIKKFPISEYSAIAIGSDGISTFYDISKSPEESKLELSVVVPKFINFKNIKGEFVKRRAKKQITSYAQDGIFHMDDFSMGAFTELPRS